MLEEIGRGGMGVVYRARQKGLGRIVALKMILHGDHAGIENRLRFLREAESLAKLRHEHIVQVYEVGEHEGKPFISLEYVEGGSLDQKLRGTPLPARDAALLVEKLASAVQAAHDAGIIHRDLKPANVLLTTAGVPRITDFGLAKRQDTSALSATGAVLGTPSYMAPEQAAGRGKTVDARADVYALGVILYECLTGRPPFRAATPMETMLQVLRDEPVAVRSLLPGTPVDLETICLKCLHKEPERRYATARALTDDLGRFLRGEPIAARPVGKMERGWRWCKRNRAVASLLSLILLLMTLGTGVAWVLALRADAEADQANEARRDAEEARRNADRDAKEALRLKGEAEEAQKRAERGEQEAVRQKEFIEYVTRLREAQTDLERGKPDEARNKLYQCNLRLQSWEHSYLLRQTQRLKLDILAHTGSVNSVAFSGDGKRIVSGSADQTLKVWDAATGQEALTLKGHTRDVIGVAFSGDGKRIVSGSRDRTVKVWDVPTPKER